MKKILAIVLAAIMLAGIMTACGGGGEASKGTPSKSANGDDIVVQEGGKISLEITHESLGAASVKKDANVGSGKHVQSIKVDEADKVVYVQAGKTAQLKYAILPSDAADPSVYFESKNTDIVKVDATGKVLGVEAGSTVVEITANDRNFKTKVTVVVYRVSNDDTKITEMLTLINNARKDANLSELTIDATLNYASTERAFEEAAEADGKMDDTRPLKDSSGKNKAQGTVFSDYNIFTRGSNRLYVWDDFKDVQAAFDALMAVEENKTAILSDDTKFNYMGAGTFEHEGCVYWCVMMYLK